MTRNITVSLCSGRTAYEVKVKENIDLISAAKKIKAKVATKHIMILDFSDVEVSLFPSGRMLIKRVANETEALNIANDLLDCISD
ncbi:MAG: hypothetical protein P1P69_01280 [Methanosarcinaceae archaeon]|nr:hypothetical protein [Methanosarcinaceae archaeon]MDF1533119.1 hypothetical protein [Methanosarcinaceae archaeon]